MISWPWCIAPSTWLPSPAVHWMTSECAGGWHRGGCVLALLALSLGHYGLDESVGWGVKSVYV